MAKKKPSRKPAKSSGVLVAPALADPKVANEADSLAQRKAYLEYMGLMTLEALVKRVGLESIMAAAVRSGREEEDILIEFFGRDRQGKVAKPEDEAGCAEAGGLTIPQLIEEWHDVTEKLMAKVTGRS